MKLLSLVRIQNKCLSKIIDFNENFLSLGNQLVFEKLDGFLKSRERMLRFFLKSDHFIQKEVEKGSEGSFLKIRPFLRALLKDQDFLKNKIFSQDQMIFKKFSETKKELQEGFRFILKKEKYLNSQMALKEQNDVEVWS